MWEKQFPTKADLLNILFQLLWLFQIFIVAGHEKAVDVAVTAENAVWLFVNLPAVDVVVAAVVAHMQKLRLNSFRLVIKVLILFLKLLVLLYGKSGLLYLHSAYFAAIVLLGSTHSREIFAIRGTLLLSHLVEMQCQKLMLLLYVLCTPTHASVALTAIFVEDGAFALHK
jgi:hypothetical protein